MRSTKGLLSNLISNLRDGNNTRKAGITLTLSLVLLSVISVSNLTSAQSISSQVGPSILGETSRTNDKILNSKTQCSEPIDIKNVSSRSNDNNKNDEDTNPGSAFDNDEDTEWSVDSAGAYLEFDIEAVKSICDIEILWEDGDHKSYNFVVSVSENGVDFKDSIRTKSSGNSDLSESYPIPGSLAKQIRITVYGNSEDETAAIKEVRINGNDVRKVGQEYKICENLPIDKFMATSSQSGDRPDNAADGDLATTWSNLGTGSFIQADLGTIKSLCGVSIAWYNGESKQYAFEVSVSKDGINFDQVYEGTSSGKSIQPQNYAFSDTDARYVRITVFGNDKNSWAGITELSVKGFTPPNDPPIADPKSVSTDMNIPIPITLSGSDPEGSTLTFTVEDLPKHGQLSSQSHDTVMYTPDKDFSGSDSFTYTTKDSKGTASNESLVSINTNNNPPIADPKSVSTDMNIPIPITLSGSDPEGSTLTFTVEDLPKHGQLSSQSHDTVMYTPDKDFSGSDSFTYTTKDSKGTTSSKVNTTIDINEVLECQILDPIVVTAMRSDGNGPSNVIDRNLNTRWSNDEAGSWIQTDLGSKAKICSVDIAWYRGDVRKNDFSVSVSDDGSIFRKVLEEQSTGASTGLEKYNLPSGTEGRFVRITADGNSENNWASITEMAVFGVDSGLEPTQTPQNQPNLKDTENDQGNSG